MTSGSETRRPARISAQRAVVAGGAGAAGWAWLLGRPRAEGRSSRRIARLGAVSANVALLAYLTWRIGFTLPEAGADRVAAWALVIFEAIPIVGILIRTITLWNIDSRGPDRVAQASPGFRTAVFIPTYNEPVEVIAPTIAASCALEPAHQTWVLDDGDRQWVADLCRAYGARYLRRDEHTHAKAGNLNHALEVLARECEAGSEEIDVIAVLDCDHVPLPTFLTDTLGWFADPELALVQGPQNYYNAGAFDDDGDTGEQGLFFHVLMPARNHDGAGPFWCGSTSLIRRRALQEIGGISTETIVEDMHTTLNLIRAGWKTVYHHQTLAVGLAPATPEQYLVQRRRWGLGAMQVLTRERLWAAKRWLSWRNYYEYLSGTLWWLEGVGTVIAFLIPAVILVTGAQTSTAGPAVFAAIFTSMFLIRLWGAKRMFRMHIHWRTAFALRILRVPVGLSCLWWLVTRRTLDFDVTPKAGAEARLRGRAPKVLWLLAALIAASLLYALVGLTGMVPWHATPGATAASGVWLGLAMIVLIMGTRRIQSDDFATSRRNAHRIPVRANITIDGVEGELVDISVGGAAVRFRKGAFSRAGSVELSLPGAAPISMQTVRLTEGPGEYDGASLTVNAGDWAALRTMSLWLFHTPAGAVDGLPAGAPAVAARRQRRRARTPVLQRQYA